MPKGIYKRTPEMKTGIYNHKSGYKVLGRKSSYPLTREHRLKMSETSKNKVKLGIHNWGDGTKTAQTLMIRKSIEYRLWREAVFARDNWTCQRCLQRGLKLDPHHIKNFAQFIKLRFAIDNGCTLCRLCHKEFHNTYGQRNNNQEQLTEFITEWNKKKALEQLLLENNVLNEFRRTYLPKE